jgi:hypothetical protein
MAHKHGINCLEVSGGKVVCNASGKELQWRRPKPQSGYAYSPPMGGINFNPKDFRTFPEETWDTIMISDPSLTGAKHLGTRFIDGSKVNVWHLPKTGQIIAQTTAMTGEPRY